MISLGFLEAPFFSIAALVADAVVAALHAGKAAIDAGAAAAAPPRRAR